MITRLADESGCSICGDLATDGTFLDIVSRSLTICRARIGSVPGSKMSTIEESPVIDSEWISSTQATPASKSCSSGTVTRFSTSSAERPSASVWTST